jgi:hypothetical protein
MKARNLFFLVCCGVATPIACSTSGDGINNQASPSGGTSGLGGGGGSSASRGGGTVVPEAGDLPDSALGWEAATPDSSLFHPLVPANCDPADLCCEAFMWPTAEPLPNILLNTNGYVKQDGKLYQYVGTQTITWPQQDCSPKNPVRYDCKDGKWWKDMGVSCPID